MTTSADIRLALEARYPSSSHALMFEVHDAAGHARSRAADAVAVGLWPSRGHLVEGIEIKVSRGDFLHEIKHPEKSEPVMQFCHHWWLATPKGLIKPEELPLTWGLLELGNGPLRVKVQAPRLQPDAPDASFVAAMLRRRAGKDHETARLHCEAEVSRRLQEHAARMERLEKDVRERALSAAQQEIDAAAKVAEATGLDLSKYNAADEIIVAIKTLRILQSSGSGWRSNHLDDMFEACRKFLNAGRQAGLLAEASTEVERAA